MIVHNNSIFDPITNSEDEMRKQAKLKKGQTCLYLRAYMMIRLLFSHEFVISDSSINLNRALRALIVKEEGEGIYDHRTLADADFADLIQNGTIKLAARDIYKGSFSESLRETQKNNKLIDLPGEKYTSRIDEICKEENIYWWNAEEVSQMFTKKIRDGLKRDEYADEINAFLRDLAYRLSDREILTYNIVKNEALKSYHPKSEEYQIVRHLLREAYDYNIPEVLNLRYSRFFDSSPKPIKKVNLEIDKVEEYDLPWPFALNFYAFAALPAECLKEFWGSSEYERYDKAMSQYNKRMVGFSEVLDALEKYLFFIDKSVTRIYNDNKYVVDKPKNLMVRFREEFNFGKDPSIVVLAKVWLWGSGIIDTVCDFIPDPTIDKAIVLTLKVLVPNLIIKGYEHFTSLPKIDHAIVFSKQLEI